MSRVKECLIEYLLNEGDLMQVVDCDFLLDCISSLEPIAYLEEEVIM